MQTALISALTAALVTLLIEYFAKPALEARKDRLVSASRARREMIAALHSSINPRIRLLMAVRNNDWTNVANLFKVIDDNAAKLSERHAEAKQTLRFDAADVASDAINLFHLQVMTMEWSMSRVEKLAAAEKSVQKPALVEKTEVKTLFDSFAKLDSKMQQTLAVVEIVYRPKRCIEKLRRRNLVHAKRLLSEVPTIDHHLYGATSVKL